MKKPHDKKEHHHKEHKEGHGKVALKEKMAEAKPHKHKRK